VLVRLPHRPDGLRVVVDCANGAASVVAPVALEAAGAEVIALATGTLAPSPTTRSWSR
jgi:phosphoglucosamine mutase